MLEVHHPRAGAKGVAPTSRRDAHKSRPWHSSAPPRARGHAGEDCEEVSRDGAILGRRGPEVLSENAIPLRSARQSRAKARLLNKV
eukprot:9174241-Pyramimonas_sp.AAC.1